MLEPPLCFNVGTVFFERKVSQFFCFINPLYFPLFKNVWDKLNRAIMWHGLWRWVRRYHFPYNSFLFKQCFIMQALTLIPIESKLLVMSFKKTLGFILISRHNFRVVLGDNLALLSRPGKFFLLQNCLNFFITDSTLDLAISNRFEIVL